MEEEQKQKPFELRVYDSDEEEAEAMKQLSPVTAGIIIIILFSIVSSLIYGMFFYRGGSPDIGLGGYILSAFVSFFIVYGMYGQTKDSDRNLQIFFGTVMLVFIDVLLRGLVLYPIVVKIFS